MKKLIVALMLLAGSAKASPYIYVVGATPGSKLYLSQGALFTPQMDYYQAFTNVAFLYHPSSSGSLWQRIAPNLSPYLPAESWSLNVGAGYASANQTVTAGPGFSINMLDTVRSEVANLLNLSDNLTLRSIAGQLAPGTGPLSLNVGRQWASNFIQDGIVPPLNQMRLKPYWFFGASYGF